MNPSFETNIPCSIYQNTGLPQMQCTNWFAANAGNPDYFHETYSCFSGFIPNNGFGWQYARTGSAYTGIGVYISPSVSFPYSREYLEGTLIDTLQQNHIYCVSFYVSAANKTQYYIDAIGLYLSNDSLFDVSTDTVLNNYTPQINNNPGNAITDTLNWILISGSYLAHGEEKFITIGNFKTNANTIVDSLSILSPGHEEAYYYIDDVSVTDCTVGINIIKPTTTQSKLYPNPTKQTQVYYTNTLAANQSGSLQLTDMLGNILATYNLNSGSNKITINTAAYAKGVYVVKVNVVGMVGESLKLVVE